MAGNNLSYNTTALNNLNARKSNLELSQNENSATNLSQQYNSMNLSFTLCSSLSQITWRCCLHDNASPENRFS